LKIFKIFCGDQVQDNCFNLSTMRLETKTVGLEHPELLSYDVIYYYSGKL